MLHGGAHVMQIGVEGNVLGGRAAILGFDVRFDARGAEALAERLLEEVHLFVGLAQGRVRGRFHMQEDKEPFLLFGKDEVVYGEVVRRGDGAHKLEHIFRFLLRGFDVHGDVRGGHDFVRDVLYDAGNVVRRVEPQCGRGFDGDVHEHVGSAFAHAQAADPAEGKLAGEGLFQRLAVLSASSVEEQGDGAARQADAHHHDDAGHGQRSEGVRHVQNGPERAGGGQEFAELDAEQPGEHHA